MIKLKRAKVENFVRCNYELCRRAFDVAQDHSGYKASEYGRRLVQLARDKMLYSPTTYSGDIYYRIFKTFDKVLK